MLPTEAALLKAVAGNRRRFTGLERTHDVPGYYLSLMVASLRKRGFISRSWYGGYRITRTGQERLHLK